MKIRGVKEIILKSILGRDKVMRATLRRNQRIIIMEELLHLILKSSHSMLQNQNQDRKKRKSRLEQLGIPKPEKRELTGDEQKRAG